ncbi:replicative DNA helicase [Arthrobacter crystallopoietes]|uniref:Replicative DNA helicase n=1 Tax=Crystallibacter crystallopoietes TaxID=37928 RepID=A0A1H1D3B1_9MICC|nr:replicative DNA helicase [Arthrobacter crystallopoietes]AUI50477.1 replicative DNA helicase [Arthrobacter crystallopoietes]SDQ71021.1 replicative DNA helicase [Arthrobacter crystallopoietes]
MTLVHADSAQAGREPDFARTPPQDLVAEQSVLGGMMLSKDAIADCVEVLRGVDFYRPSHEAIYEAIIDLYGRGEPADAVTVSDLLTKRGEISRIGGPAYLHTLIQSVPTAANAGFYAEIVRERAVLRRLVDAGTKIVQLGYSQDGEVDDIVNQAQAEIYTVAERRTAEDYVALKDIIEGTVDEIESAGHRGEGMTGVPTGFYELDELTQGLHGGQMIVIAARPAVGKSTFALDFARSAAIKNNMTTVFFSLEMGRNEIAMRLLSAEATIGLQDLRKGTIKDEQWGKIATTMGRMNDAPLFIDDSPNMSLMEIRAKCRRLKQRHDLKLVVLDYLQLMSSGKRVESRQQEVSEFSRALKLLAKELEVPVIALSQLNRGSEQRTDKKPMVSDLRESGCLTADTRVLRSDTGAETTMGELFASGAKDVPVWSLDESLRYVERHLTHVFSTGVKPVYRLTLSSGKTVRATENHPFFTYEGWKPLGELTVGDRLGVPRHVNGPSERVVWSDEQVVAAAKVLGANATRTSPEIYDVEDGHVSDAMAFVPSAVFALPKKQIALFFGQLWTAGGTVGVTMSGTRGDISFASGSRAVLDGLATLLLRFGISAEIAMVSEGFRLAISGTDDQRRFLQEINVYGDVTPAAERLLELVRDASAMPAPKPVPDTVWSEVRNIMEDPSEPALGRMTAVLEKADLDVEAVNDLFWDSIVSIIPDGEEEVFDATVLGNHNFVANGIAVHNSIEQDADMVILLHREDIYDKESPRAGEADVIVAKHRNGPTKTIVVGFQGHYSRFSNMAVEHG